MGVSSQPYYPHKAQVFTGVEKRAAAQKRVSEVPSISEGFISKKKKKILRIIISE